MSLVRWPFRLLDRLRKQQCVADCVSQGNSCRNIAFQHGDNSSHGFNSTGAVIGNYAAYSKRNADYPIQVGESRRMLEIGNGESYRGHLNILVAQPNYSSIQSVANVSHILAPGLKARFGRSCRAFVNAWRAA